MFIITGPFPGEKLGGGLFFAGFSASVPNVTASGRGFSTACSISLQVSCVYAWSGRLLGCSGGMIRLAFEQPLKYYVYKISGFMYQMDGCLFWEKRGIACVFL